MPRPPIEAVPEEYAQMLGGVIHALTDAWAENLAAPTLLSVQMQLPDSPPLSFPLFATLLFTAQLFDQDPEFMHWLVSTSGLMEDNVLGASNQLLIDTLKLSVEEEAEALQNAK